MIHLSGAPSNRPAPSRAARRRSRGGRGTAISFIWISEFTIFGKIFLNEKNLKKICNDLELDFDSLMKKSNEKIEYYNSLAEHAAKINVFGSPTYVINGEIFWGQDRLALLEEYIQENL